MTERVQSTQVLSISIVTPRLRVISEITGFQISRESEVGIPVPMRQNHSPCGMQATLGFGGCARGGGVNQTAHTVPCTWGKTTGPGEWRPEGGRGRPGGRPDCMYHTSTALHCDSTQHRNPRERHSAETKHDSVTKWSGFQYPIYCSL